VQNQQLGGRVYIGHAMPLVHKVRYIKGVIYHGKSKRVQAYFKIVASLQLRSSSARSHDFHNNINGQSTIQENETVSIQKILLVQL
jgi:hypothetical protein